jgi:hypothetical protein
MAIYVIFLKVKEGKKMLTSFEMENWLSRARGSPLCLLLLRLIPE